MGDQLKNLMIGLFVIAAIAIIIFVLLFLHPRVGNEEKVLRVRFADLDKINVGTRVTFAGKPVGEVSSIEEIREAVDHRIGRNGTIYVYDVFLKVDSSVNVYNTDEIYSRTSGLLGEKSINIDPKPPEAGEKLIIINNQIIYATELGSVEDAIKKLTHIVDVVEVTLDSTNDILQDIKKKNIIGKTADTIENIRNITHALNKPEKWSHALDNLDESMTTINKMSDSGYKIVDAVYKGQGTVGHLLMKDDIYLKFNAILNKADIVMNDVNHYGLLYSTNTDWQRLRARRLNLLQRLRTPQEFSNYFNDEVDNISTSLSRVTMVLGDCDPYICDLLENRQYTMVFSELLKRVKSLEEELNSYNTQIVDIDARKIDLSECQCR